MNRYDVLFSVGFRPFFLLAGIGALLPVLAWVIVSGGGAFAMPYYGLMAWHGHEMVFGYAVAVMAGFLLTAVRNWTGQQTAQGHLLAALALLWLAGRIAPWLDGLLPRSLIALVDVAFLPALALVIGRPIARSGQKHNLVFPLMLCVLAMLNAAVHAEALGFAPGLANRVLLAAVMMVMVVISVMGGRIIPRFSEHGVDVDFRAVSWPRVEQLATPALVALCASILLLPDSLVTSGLALFAALLHARRLSGWYTGAIWREPMVWILQIAYAWLCAGLLLVALAPPGVVTLLAALHALTAGALGSLTLGMMTRVSLGHTGRPIAASRAMLAAFIMLQMAAVLRVAGVVLLPAAYPFLIVAAGLLWCAVYLTFLAVFVPVYLAPRAR